MRAVEIGEEHICQFVDILQYMCGLVWNWRSIPHAYSGGVHTFRRKDVYIIDLQDNVLSASHSNIDPLQPILFDENYLKLCYESWHIKIAGAITNAHSSKLQKSILRSIYWYATGSRVLDPGFAVLYFIYSLESLFPADGNNTERLSDTCAFHLRNYYKDKKAVKKTMRQYYQKRSKLCHGGASTKISEYDAMWLSMATARAIRERLKMEDEYTTHEAYDDYIETLKFS